MVGTIFPVAISGIAGRFPESDGMEEFCTNLYNAVDMVTECTRGWDEGTLKIPHRMGQVKNLDKFDAEAFGVHSRLAENMDPRLRLLLEVSHESITDAGINILELSGTNTGVYVGATGEEGAAHYRENAENPSGYVVVGSFLFNLANRLSFTYNLRGPSIAMDTACSSSLLALQQALSAIRLGLCEAALVSGSQILLDPKTTRMFTNLEMTSADGKCKSFDNGADGYVRSEAVVSVYICKPDLARRLYATIIHAGTNTDGYKTMGFTYPSAEVQEELQRRVYTEAGINPQDVGYLEAHGTGTQAGDLQELTAITRVFCFKRSPRNPLLVGSVKSNMGHAEPASGLCGLAKLVIIAQKRVIPGNLHYYAPNPKIPALVDGRIKVVSFNTAFEGELVAINSFGIGGSNVHAVLKFPSLKEMKAASSLSSSIPLLMPLSGRTIGVSSSLEGLAGGSGCRALAALLQLIARYDTSGHCFRSVAIYNSNEKSGTVSIRSTDKRIGKERRPLCFIFSGTGTRYRGMADDMMKLKAFKTSIERSTTALRDQGFDLSKELAVQDDDDQLLNQDGLSTCICIVAVQIALVDLLEACGLIPEKMLGHSLGEVAAAYADKCLTAEQTLSLALVRGRAFRLAEPGAMASVGLSWEQAQVECLNQNTISPACDNSVDNVTVSGKAEIIDKFVVDLQSKGIFAKRIQSSGMAYHSRYMKPCADYMRTHLAGVIREPYTSRSDKWISTSMLGFENASTACSVNYWINNVQAPVQFREAVGHIPENGVVLEVAPHSVLQAILKRALPPTVDCIGLMNKKSATSNCKYFLEALGQVYLTGNNPDFSVLYEQVEFPVEPKTPMISPAVRWDHSHSWNVPMKKKIPYTGTKIEISPKNQAERFYLDHAIDGRFIFPGVGYLYIVWIEFAKRHGQNLENCPVAFENVRFERSTFLSTESTVELYVSFHNESGKFEVFEGDSAVCQGKIQALGGTSYTITPVHWGEVIKLAENSAICADELYKAFRLSGYDYSGVFRGIQKADPCGDWAEIIWSRNWVGFLDSVLQLQILSRMEQGLALPIRIQKAVFDPKVLLAFLSKQKEEGKEQNIPTKNLEYINTVMAPGFEFRGLKVASVSRRQSIHPPTLSAFKYLPFVYATPRENKLNSTGLQDLQCLFFCLEIVMDNTVGNHFMALEFADPKLDVFVCSKVKNKLAPKFSKSSLFVVSDEVSKKGADNDIHVFTSTELKQRHTLLEPNLIIVYQGNSTSVDQFMNEQCFLLCIDGSGSNATEKTAKDPPFGLQLVVLQPVLSLYRRKRKPYLVSTSCVSIQVQENNFDWVEDLKDQLNRDADEENPCRIYLFSNSLTSGLQGLVRCLRQESYRQLRCFEALDPGYCFDFDTPSKDLKEVMELDLVYNVYSSGSWGCYSTSTLRNNTATLKDASTATTSSCFAHILHPGDLSSLAWIQNTLKIRTSPEEEPPVLCDVSYAALNFRDVMVATGKLSRDALPAEFAHRESILGLEFSGVLRDTGRRVFGMQVYKCLASTLEIDEDLGYMLDVPNGWTLAEAATVGLAYLTAYYGLVMKARVLEGETVLIHSGAGSAGQAVIAVALSKNCRVITTVSSEKKRAFLREQFPQLDSDENFANSRDPVAFEHHVMRVTNGRGVDIVVNSLSQDSLQASVRCLASNGRFIEIGKFDIFNNTELGMEFFLRNTEFHGAFIDNLFQSNLSPFALRERSKVKELVREGLASGIVKPLPSTEFESGRLEEAFRFMASGKHLGKILVKLRDDPLSLTTNIPAAAVLPRTYFYPHKVYVLVGGLGGMGLELADWMVTRGARKLIFVTRTGAWSWYQKYRIRGWQVKGASITISTTDVTTVDGVCTLLETVRNFGPILGGVFNLAVQLMDGLFVNQSREKFEVASKPKLGATILFDNLTRDLTPSLDYFVVFSSTVALIGNPGQSNYGFANSGIERICQQRRAAGLHGLAIQWGPIGDVGVLHATTGGKDTPFGGMLPQPIVSVLETMDTFLNSSEAVVSSFIVDTSANSSKGAISGEKPLVELVASILGVKEIGLINPEDTLTELGMDSLMASEVKHVLQDTLKLSVGSLSVSNMTFGKLGGLERNKEGNSCNNQSKNQVVLEFGNVPLVLPRTTVVPMESMKTNNVSKLFVVHPVEGSLIMLSGLVKGLDCTVYGFECTSDAPLSSLPALASHYIESMRSVQAKGPYRLAGYSYGGAVAVEMAIQLEENGDTVERLLLLDSSHRFIQGFVQMITRHFKIVSGETLWLLYFLLMHSIQNLEKVESELMSLPTWEGKLNLVAEKLSQLSTALSLEEIKGLAMSFVKRVSVGLNYYPHAKIQCETVLVRTRKSGYDSLIGEDYGLGEICTRPVKVLMVNGDHTCFYEKSSELGIHQLINDSL